MVKSMASSFLNLKQHAIVNIILGRSVSDILSSRNLLVGLWQSMKVELNLSYKESLAEGLLSLASQMGVGESVV